MGRAYAKELIGLGETYLWACASSIEPLEEFVAEAQTRPLLTVGSGGSATAAHFAALLHRFHGCGFSRHATPLDILLSEPYLQDTAALLLSASGKNRDVLAALEHCVQHEARAIATLCTQRGSPLATGARRFERGYAFEEEAPWGKDGFLATNSLLATCVFIARAYGVELPEQLSSVAQEWLLPDLERQYTVLVLHGGWASPAATDLESKLHESAIASVHVSDYRNFGHGRHLWLARRGSSTVVVTLVTPETYSLAQRTRSLLPRDVSVVELRTTHDGPTGTIDLLQQCFKLVATLGELQAFDPGRPRVPEFGRKLYHLSPPVTARSQPAPVTRKVARNQHLGQDQQTDVLSALRHFVKRLCTTKLGALVLDYDGTICSRADRFGPLRPEVARECQRLLEGGLIIGIATGRGRSVRESLQKALPRVFWDRVILGYYNGGEIASLVRDDVPLRGAHTEAPLDAAIKLLEGDPLLHSIATFTPRGRQITVEPSKTLSTLALASHVMTVLAPLEERGVRVLTSSHSVDVLPLGVGKLAVVADVRSRIREDLEVLSIGDRGAWPGNDCALLSHEPSLSVDEVSASLTTCWNISPPGVSGVEAALGYLQAIRIRKGYATMDARHFWSTV